MSRYSKIKSKYILSKFHQDTSQGAIYERDWTTIGNVHRLEPGKQPYYGSSGFLFTDNSIPVYKKKRENGKWVGKYTYEDVKDSEDIVNLIKVNTDSENLSDYAYWGSMTELFRGSVEHIIETFPGRLRSTKKKLSIHHHLEEENNGVEYWDDAPGYILGNPFGLDMHTDTDDIDTDRILRYVAFSWKHYLIEDYDEETVKLFPLTTYMIDKDVYKQYDCEGRYFLVCSIVIFARSRSVVVDTYLADGNIVYCYRPNDDPSTYQFIISYFSGLSGLSVSSLSQINGNTPERQLTADDLHIPSNFAICPDYEIVENYFRGLEGFEWKLLNNRKKPYYRNTFLLPVQLDNGNWRLVKRSYTWPSEGIWIDIESTDYDSFINDMISLCEIYDGLWCDSIWRCMVHESVKNFDWSYRREYDENDEVDNIEGGNRMKDVMRLYGIIYDKAKRYVDGISFYNKVTYDGYNNCPNAQISDRNILQGWDVTSTQHMFYWYDLESKTGNYDKYIALPVRPVNVDEESPDFISVTCPGVSGTLYYRKQKLPVSDISLDALFFDNDNIVPSIVGKQQNPWCRNNVYGRLYVEVGLASVTPHDYDFSLPYRTLTEYPYQLFNRTDGITYPPFLQVVSNNGTRYYKLLNGENEIITNNAKYTNGTWFESMNENAVTPATTDILFNRALNLSTNRILKSKGTKEAIDMVFGLFGFGRYGTSNETDGMYNNPYGDYTIEEQYGAFTPKQLDEIFYFYETISEEDAQGHNPEQLSSLPKNPTGSSVEYIVVNNQSYNTYYRLNSSYTVAEAIKQLYAHRLTEREYEDYYSGIPMRESVFGNTHLVIPFFDRNKYYEGDLYYEAKGGWMNTGEYSWNNSETIPYLHVLQRIRDLFTVNTSDAKNGDIYYVADVSDYYKFTNDIPYYLSNFFKLKDKYESSDFSSWVNIPIEGPIQNIGDTEVWDEGVTKYDYMHAKHLNDIIPSVLFNNPHTGYDRYDMGTEYKKYMETPYKYSADNYLYDDDFFQNMAQQFSFVFDNVVFSEGDKCEITASTISYSTIGNVNTHPASNENQLNDITINDKYLKITLIENSAPIDATNPEYRMHLEYMRNVVLKYVAQVIPSTTMLVLDNFETPETISEDTVIITTHVIGEGVVYGSGTYPKTSMVTLNAVPSDGYHFFGWQIGGRNIQPTPPDAHEAPMYDVFETSLTIMACADTIYTAVFVEDCGIELGCQTVNCGGTPSVN